MAVDIDPTLDIVKDGSESETFTATTIPSGLSGLTYEWTWVAEPEAGNNPSVDFSSSEDHETTVELAHWYALPDDTCEAHPNSSYTLTCIVKHNGQPVCSDTTGLCVTLIDPGGKCSAPQLKGAPAIAYDSEDELYYVSGVGTLSRILASVEIYLPETSQFRDKLETHEKQHKQDYDNGFDGHKFVTVEEFYARIEGLTDSTQAGLEARIYEEAEAYYQDEADEIENVKGCLEIRAYKVSDSIAPQYYYHNCGQYTCP